MSQREPDKAYAYQSGALGTHGGEYIFAVSGPGAEYLGDARFRSRASAQLVADSVNRQLGIMRGISRGALEGGDIPSGSPGRRK